MSDTTNKPAGTIEVSDMLAAVWTENGPAVYPTLDDAREAIASGTVEVHEGDSEYYEARDQQYPWREAN